jgi:hypothetical protein
MTEDLLSINKLGTLPAMEGIGFGNGSPPGVRHRENSKEFNMEKRSLIPQIQTAPLQGLLP